MNPSKLCLIGASCRAAAQSAKRAGIETLYAWDEFLDEDLVQISVAQPFSELAAQPLADKHDKSTAVVLCGGMENRPDMLESIIDRGGICGVGIDSLRRLRSLEAWKDWAKRSGVSYPETLLLTANTTQDQIRNLLKDPQGWLLKPISKAGGIQVRHPTSVEDALRLAVQNSPQEPWCLQQAISGITIGATYLSHPLQTSLVGIARGIPSAAIDAPLPFIYSGNIAPYLPAPNVANQIKRFGEIVRSETDILGLWQADFQVDSEGRLWLLEINPRWSASMELHEILQGMSWMKKHVSTLTETSSTLSFKQPENCPCPNARRASFKAIGKGIVYAPCDLSVQSHRLKRLWHARWRGSQVELERHSFRMLDIPRISWQAQPSVETTFPMGTPIATVLSAGKNHAGVLEQIQQAKRVVLSWLKTI